MVVFMVLFLNLAKKKKKKKNIYIYILYLYNTYMIGDGMRAMAGGCEKESVCEINSPMGLTSRRKDGIMGV
jgi:hypothetical protein